LRHVRRIYVPPPDFSRMPTFQSANRAPFCSTCFSPQGRFNSGACVCCGTDAEQYAFIPTRRAAPIPSFQPLSKACSSVQTVYHVEEDAVASERAAMLQRTLATLPDAQREALQMAFYQGLSQRQIAAKTGVPLGTIKTRLELGVRKLRAAVTSLGGAEEWSLIRA